MNDSKAPVRPDVSIWMADLLPLIQEAFAQGKDAPIPVTGTSMVPTLLGGRDRVRLSAPLDVLKKYDLPLYRRQNGQFILHRIVSVEKDGTYTCCGDHQWEKETGIRRDQILAVTVQIHRKGKDIPVSSFGYRLWVRFWVMVLPCRRFFLRVYHGGLKLRKSSRPPQ